VTRNQSTKFTPAELIDHFLEQTEKLNTVREKAHLFIEKAQERQKSAHDKKIRTEVCSRYKRDDNFIADLARKHLTKTSPQKSPQAIH